MKYEMQCENVGLRPCVNMKDVGKYEIRDMKYEMQCENVEM